MTEAEKFVLCLDDLKLYNVTKPRLVMAIWKPKRKEELTLSANYNDSILAVPVSRVRFIHPEVLE